MALCNGHDPDAAPTSSEFHCLPASPAHCGKRVNSRIAEKRLGVKRVAVIVPYFQRSRGLLRRSLESVYSQDVGPDVRVTVVVVDDDSPAPPEQEIAGLSRADFSIRIVKRPNGGPGKARNTGLEAAPESDVIAFLDSDDVWRSDHLARALRGLQRGAQFHFANNIYSDGITWFSTLGCREEMIAAATLLDEDEYIIERDRVMSLLLRECLPHTSTVVLDARFRNGLVFDQTQSMAGEDYLFWAAFVQSCERVSFTTALTAERGRGVDVYRSTYSWDHPDCVRSLFSNLTLRKKFLARLARTDSDRRVQHRWIALLRRDIAYLFIRNAFKFWRQNLWVAGRLTAADPGFWLLFPFNVVASIGQRLQAAHAR